MTDRKRVPKRASGQLEQKRIKCSTEETPTSDFPGI